MISVLEQLARHAAGQPNQVALDNGERVWTYEQLWHEVSTLATILGDLGVQRIGLVGDNSPAWLIADLACWQAGLLNVPVPGFFSASQIGHLTDTAGLDALIGPARVLQAMGYRSPRPLDNALAYTRLTPGAIPELAPDIRKVTFTSGSSGTPKGVCLTGDNLDATAYGLAQVLSNQALDHHLCVLPLATLLENVAGGYLPLMLGARLTIPPLATLGFQGVSRFDLATFVGTLNTVSPRSIILVPQLLTGLVMAAEQGLPLPSSLRFVAVGGGKVAPDLLARADALKLPVYEGYGLSECGSVVALNTPGARRLGAAGQVLPHVTIRCRADHEIEVSGSIMTGYLGEPPMQGSWLRTGDLGSIDEDGFVHVHGRAKNLFITSFGRNINPEWLESECATTPVIQQVAVFGEALPRPVAVVVPRAGLTAEHVHAALTDINERLPDYARIDRFILADTPFSPANELATANGRIVRQRVEAQYIHQFSEPDLSAHATVYNLCPMEAN